MAVPCVNIGDVLMALGRPHEAEAYYRRALALQEKGLEPGHPYLAYTLTSLAEVERSMKRPGAAAALLERALTIREKPVMLLGRQPQRAAVLAEVPIGPRLHRSPEVRGHREQVLELTEMLVLLVPQDEDATCLGHEPDADRRVSGPPSPGHA